MEWNIFEEWLDIPLYMQMRDLIGLACSKEGKYGLSQKNKEYELFSGKAKKTMEEEYGLHYPGEVLERLGERREITVRQIRALGLALARTKSLHEDSMFIGNQLAVFLKKINALAKDDVFILGIRYLMEEKTKRQHYEALVHYKYGKMAEILFALSVLPGDNVLWENIKGKLNAKLGQERDFSVYGNVQIYVWLAQNFQFRVRGYRKKDMDALKYLMRLPFENAFGEGMVRKKLLENGYGTDAVSYLNYQMIREVDLSDTIRAESITAEKMAIETCRYFLNVQEECPPQAYELCRDLCCAYKTFRIKVTGYGGLADALADKVIVKNVASFLILYPYIGNKKSVTCWSQFSLTDPNWDALYQSLSREDYDGCVSEALLLEKDNGRLIISLKRYEELTGEDYLRRFWEKADYHGLRVFTHLADYGAIPVKEYLEQSLLEYSQDEAAAGEKWKHMAWHLQRYMKKVSTYEAYDMLKLLIENCGVSETKWLYSVGEVLKSCFIDEKGYHSSKKKPDIFRPFLDVEEHQALFAWMEEYVFQSEPEEYADFLVQVLGQEDNLLWFPKEDARAVFFCMRERLKNEDRLIPLQRLYLTEQEQQDQKSRESFIRERKNLKQRMENIKKMKLEFSKKIAKSRGKAGQFRKISQFIGRQMYSYTDEAKKMAAGYLRATAKRGQLCLQEKTDLEELFALLSSLYTGGILEMQEIKEMVEKVEMKEQHEETEVSE